ADCEYPVADLDAIGISELRHGEIPICIDLEYGQIGLFIGAYNLGGIVCRVSVELDLNLRGSIYNVVVSQDVALLVDDDTRSQAALGGGPVVGKIEEPIAAIVKRIAKAARASRPPDRRVALRRGNASNRGFHALYDGRGRTRKVNGIRKGPRRSGTVA